MSRADRQGKSGRVKKILFSLAGFVLLSPFITGIIWMGLHEVGLARAEAEWQNYKSPRIENFGAVKTLAILPLVNWHTKNLPGEKLRGEAGVSYLVQTDRNTILFDLGHNAKNETPSPLEHNMRLLGIKPADPDMIFISHAHFDHVGGRAWSKVGSFSSGTKQIHLGDKKVFVPIPLTYPGLKPEHTPHPRPLAVGVATSGTIARQLFIGRIDEQALVVNVAGKGLVLIVGCGHQTLEKIINRVENSFREKIYGIIGDLHYPVPAGRINILGLNAQRIFASGDGPFRPLQNSDIEADIKRLRQRNPGIVALGGHDSSDETIARFKEVFTTRYKYVRVGEWIQVR